LLATIASRVLLFYGLGTLAVFFSLRLHGLLTVKGIVTKSSRVRRSLTADVKLHLVAIKWLFLRRPDLLSRGPLVVIVLLVVISICVLVRLLLAKFFNLLVIDPTYVLHEVQIIHLLELVMHR